MNIKRMNIKGRFLFNLIFIALFALIGLVTLFLSIIK